LFLLGFSFGIGPCLASCGPLLISYAAATSQGLLKSIITYVLFSLSRVTVYLALGLSVFFFGQAVTHYSLGGLTRYLYGAGGLFIVSIGVLIMFGRTIEHALCRKACSFFLAKDAKTIILFGLITGILPCAPLISVLSYIGLIGGTWGKSVLYSAAFGLGTIFSPLLVLVVFAGLIPRSLITGKSFVRIFNAVCGAVIVVLGVLLLRKAF